MMQKHHLAEELEAPPLSDSARRDPFVLSLEGFEGPIDLLLHLVREHKMDLDKLPILPLAEQYIKFIERACTEHLDEAAEYLVMAAYLAYLKSCLLLPRDETDDDPLAPEIQAEILAWRLKRLEAMRNQSAKLMSRCRLGLDVLPRGCPEGIRLIRSPLWQDTLFELVRAYAVQKMRLGADKAYQIVRRPILSVEEAYKVLSKRLSLNVEWEFLERWMPVAYRASRRSALASIFTAALMMAKDGLVELKQKAPFAPIYLRARQEKRAQEAEEEIQEAKVA